MCNKNGNRELVCTVGDLTPGSQYRTPSGEAFLVLDKCNLTTPVGVTPVADLRTGRTREVAHDVKLGRDRQDRLYASRYLNPAPTMAAPAERDLSDRQHEV